jgi:hypothetical protein
MNLFVHTRLASACRARRFVVMVAAIALALAFSLAYAAIASATPPAVDDTQVNAADSATDVANNNTTQSETSLAVRGTTICAGFNDSNAADRLSGFARSTNSGQTWTDRGGLGAAGNGDATLAVDQDNGNFYYGGNATIGGEPAIGVAVSTDDCLTFGALIDASAASSGLNNVGNHTTLSDKPSIAVDNTGGTNDGNIYVCWTRFIDTSNPIDNTAEQAELRFSRSTDGGANYVNEQVLQANGPAPFGCSVKVGPNGEVYVAWADRFGGTLGDIQLRVSTDGGQNFAATTNVSTGNRLPGTDNVVNCGPNNNRTALNGNIRMLHQAWLAVDTSGGTNNGNLYAVWMSDPAGATDNSDVFFSRSTNGGANWSTPVQLGDTNATDQFEPNVNVAGNGDVSVVWYDRINDQANNLNIDVYKAFSTDGGQTFGAAQRVTNQSFGVPPINPNFDPAITNCYMGEYIAVAADAGTFYYSWGDNRNTVMNTTYPTGRLDPDVFFESEPAPSAPATLTLSPKTDSNPVDAQHCVTATVVDSASNPTANITVRFSVTGSINTSGSQTTDANGEAQFCYTGPPLPGADSISAYADTNNTQTQDPGEPSDTATKTWVLPSGTALCVVKITNGGWIVTDDGDRANFGGVAKESGSLVSSGSEEYQDQGPVEPMNVHSLQIQAVTCNTAETQASIFGQARIDGTGVHNFRIDVQDYGSPGKGSDHYRIRLDTGYDSGDHILRGGNVQIH